MIPYSISNMCDVSIYNSLYYSCNCSNPSIILFICIHVGNSHTIIYNNYMSIISICVAVPWRISHTILVLGWIHVHMHVQYAYTIISTHTCIYVHVTVTYFLSCDIHEYSYFYYMYKYEEITYQFHNNSS